MELNCVIVLLIVLERMPSNLESRNLKSNWRQDSVVALSIWAAKRMFGSNVPFRCPLVRVQGWSGKWTLSLSCLRSKAAAAFIWIKSHGELNLRFLTGQGLKFASLISVILSFMNLRLHSFIWCAALPTWWQRRWSSAGKIQLLWLATNGTTAAFLLLLLTMTTWVHFKYT